MKKNGLFFSFITSVVLISAPATGLVTARLWAADGNPAGVVDQGRVVYERNCAICHGTLGDGRGMAQMMLRTKPRDLRQGIFKFRSTPTGSLPTDEDLFRTITQGLRGTGMVAQDHLPEAERRAVVHYVKTFSERFQNQEPQPPIRVPEPLQTPELVMKGRAVYHEAGCSACHGSEGRGNGASAQGLRDYWGYPIEPADLTRPLKRGSSVEAIYQTLITGLDGTPMPSYREALSNEDLWALARYVASLNTGALSPGQGREEQAGQMVVRMHGGMGPGMMPMMRERHMR